jgi:hypothetical protein
MNLRGLNMKPVDYAKAFGLGVAALALNLLVLVAVVFVYANLVNPGQPQEFYSQIAPQFGRWTAPFAGPLLIFLLVWAFSRRRPERNAYVFGVAVFASYLIVDLGVGLATAPASSFLRLPFFAGMAGSALAAFLGASAAASNRFSPRSN